MKPTKPKVKKKPDVAVGVVSKRAKRRKRR